jgi:hypothetical protein
MPEIGKEKEANGGHRGDRTLHRTWSRFDRMHPVSTEQQSGTWARVCNRCIRSLAGPERPVGHPEEQCVAKG